MNRADRRAHARMVRKAPVVRSVAKQRGLAFVAGVAFGVVFVLGCSVLASLG